MRDQKLHTTVVLSRFWSQNANTLRPEQFLLLSCWKRASDYMARSTCPLQDVKATSGSEHFWKVSCWKTARSTFPTQNVKSTAGSEHFWQVSCWKCKRLWRELIWTSECSKHWGFGAFLAVEMLKKRTPPTPTTTITFARDPKQCGEGDRVVTLQLQLQLNYNYNYNYTTTTTTTTTTLH